MSEPKKTRRKDALDRAGVLASLVCAVHCALCAALPGLVATLGLAVVFGEAFEWSFSVVAMTLASGGLILAWNRRRSALALSALAVGITGLLAARFLEEAGVHGVGTTIGVLSGIGLVLGHLLNIRASYE